MMARLSRHRRWPLAIIAPACLLLLSSCGTDSSFLHPEGIVAAAQKRWFFDIIICMMIVVLPVFVLVPLFAWRYRRQNTKMPYRPHWDFSWPLEIAIWGIPVIIVAVLSALVIGEETRFDPYSPIPGTTNPLKVDVIALNWKWLFIYPDQHVATVGRLVIPAGRAINFQLTSDATMQSFFIPSLGSQIYAMAGMVTRLHLMARRPATLLGENTQFNGDGFTKDSFTVSVLSPQDFAAWTQAVQSQGSELDDAAYRKIARDNTTAETNAAFGVPPGGTLSFSSIRPNLFTAIVKKYTDLPQQVIAANPP